MDKVSYIDALRGVAILLVVSIHTVQQVRGMPEPLSSWLHDGGAGVTLFYVVSAFTLLRSWHDRNDGTRSFYIRRLFRIAPLFWLAIAAYMLFWGTTRDTYAPGGITVTDVLLTIVFLHGLMPRTINSVVPGDWSVGNEMLFYAAFPLIARRISSLRSALVFFCIAVAVAYTLDPLVKLLWSSAPEQGDMPGRYEFIWIGSQLPMFASGFVAYFAVHQLKAPTRLVANLGLAGIAAAILLIMWFVHLPDDFPLPIETFYGPLFGGAVYLMSAGGGAWIQPMWLRRIGVLSFGMYLSHFMFLSPVDALLHGNTSPWLWPVRFVLVAVGAALTAWCLQRAIEAPMIGIGRKIARSVVRSRPATPSLVAET